ncbi:hypothetical protein HK102_011818, partial [Quaeritorhiza haematococci]
PPSPPPAWFQEWITCVYENAPNGQNACTQIAQRNLPDNLLTEAVYVSFLMAGVWAYICVGTSLQPFREIGELLARRGWFRVESSNWWRGSSTSHNTSSTATTRSGISVTASTKSLTPAGER